MTNVGYIIAAYAITLGTLTGYALLVWSRLRVVDRELAGLTTTEEGGHGRP